MKAMTEPTTHTLDVPGAVLTYDVRSGGASNEPPLMLIGSPMGAAGFKTLASHFADRTAITYDPRGVERSHKADPTSESTPDQHADDLHRVIADLRAGPVDLFASSGGAVNALALVSKHPEDVRILVAHEPPAFKLLPDGPSAIAANRDIHETYQESGFGPAMAKFIALVMQKGEIPADYTSRPAPNPQMFGLPTQDDGKRDDPLVGQNIVTCASYQFDFHALREASTRIVIAVGEESDGELAHRAAVAVAKRLQTDPIKFPSNHAGFLGGEYGQHGKPDEFAAKLREVLASGD